jgi:hypothetical protein
MQEKLVFDTETRCGSRSSLIHFITSNHGSFNFLKMLSFVIDKAKANMEIQDAVSLGEYLPTSRRIVIFTVKDSLTLNLKAIRSF